MTLSEIVSAYIHNYRESACEEMGWFQFESNLTATIQKAALCLRPDQKQPRRWDKRHSHQLRLSKAILEDGERRLQCRAKELERAPDFAALHCIVEREIDAISGIGPLTVYDVAHRIGAFLGKSPELVYLHRGTKDGAAALGISGKAIEPDKLPPPFSRLTAAECEDCLCIYKDQLSNSLWATYSKGQKSFPGPCRAKLRFRSAVVSGRCGAIVRPNCCDGQVEVRKVGRKKQERAVSQ